MILPWHRCHSFGWVVATKATGEIVVRYLSNGAIFFSLRIRQVEDNLIRCFEKFLQFLGLDYAFDEETPGKLTLW